MAAVLAGCAGYGSDTPRSSTLGAGFGDAVYHNAAVQTVDPVPMGVNDGAPPLDGTRAAAAVDRYRNGDVLDLEVEKTFKDKVN